MSTTNEKILSEMERSENLTDIFGNYGFVQPKKPDKTCRTCAYRQRWQCGGSIIQYCIARKSNRTFNGLLKIKVTNPACELYKNETL